MISSQTGTFAFFLVDHTLTLIITTIQLYSSQLLSSLIRVCASNQAKSSLLTVIGTSCLAETRCALKRDVGFLDDLRHSNNSVRDLSSSFIELLTSDELSNLTLPADNVRTVSSGW